MTTKTSVLNRARLRLCFRGRSWAAEKAMVRDAIAQAGYSRATWPSRASSGCIRAVTGEISATSPGVHRLDAFDRGTDGALWEHYGDGRYWALGGVLTSSPSAVAWWKPIGGVEHEQSASDVFARGADDALHSRTLDAPLGDSAWTIDKNWGGKFY